MNTPLFRTEVLQARQAQWLGSIRIGRPLSFSLITGAALAMAAALIAFACWGEVTRKVTVHGLLLPAGGLIQVSAAQAGVLAELLVREGDEVLPGQPLLRLRSERITAGGDAALLNAQALSARRDSLATERRLTEQSLRQRQDAIAQRLQSLQAEERQAQSELETNRLRVQLAVKSLERQNELARSGFVAAAQVQQKQEELLDLQLRERNAQRGVQALQRELQAARADRLASDTQAGTALAQIDRAAAALGQEITENEGRGGLTIAAPQAGRVSALTLGLGQSVQAGQTLLSLLPRAQGGTSAGGSASDNPAELQAQLYAPFPYQKFGMAEGKVQSVSQTPIAAQDLPAGQAQSLLAAAQANEPMYRITVRLAKQEVTTYGDTQALKVGMTLDADVLQDKRAIWEWVLEPLRSMHRL